MSKYTTPFAAEVPFQVSLEEARHRLKNTPIEAEKEIRRISLQKEQKTVQCRELALGLSKGLLSAFYTDFVNASEPLFLKSLNQRNYLSHYVNSTYGNIGKNPVRYVTHVT